MEYDILIKKTAWRLFSNNGIKATSIEAICKELKISKKTFYKYFKNKQDLIISIFLDNRNMLQHVVNKGKEQQLPPMQIFLRLIKQLRVMMTSKITVEKEDTYFYLISPPIIEELPVVYPEVWQEIDHFRHQMLEQISTLLENEKDIYIKEEINTKVISAMLFSIMDNIIHPDFLTKHRISAIEAIDSAFALLFTGIIKDEKQPVVIEALNFPTFDIN